MKSKRLLALLLTSAMTASMILAGCGGGNSGNSGNSESSGGGSSSGDTTAADDTASAGVSTEIDMDEEPYTVAIQVVTLPGTDYSAGEAAVRKRSMPLQSLPLTVK